MSRRARARQDSRPWLNEPTDREDHEDDSEPYYLATGERIDTHSAWALPGQQQQQQKGQQ